MLITGGELSSLGGLTAILSRYTKPLQQWSHRVSETIGKIMTSSWRLTSATIPFTENSSVGLPVPFDMMMYVFGS